MDASGLGTGAWDRTGSHAHLRVLLRRARQRSNSTRDDPVMQAVAYAWAMSSIAHALAESASRYAHRAVDNYVGNDLGEFYLAAGIAIEQAMKSRLARDNVVFIAPERSFTSAVELWRTRDDIGSLPVGTKTIGGADAVARVAIVERRFAPHAESVKEILRFRNGEAHIGAPGASDHRRVFVDFLAAIATLLEVPGEDFWGVHAELVRVTLDENAAGVARKVTERLAGAAATYRRRFDALDEHQRSSLIDLAGHDAEQRRSDDALVQECPGCGTEAALLHGDNSVEVDIDVDHREGVIIGAGHYVEFQAQYLECLACGLELDGQEELEAAGLETVFPNDAADTDTYLRQYYEDEY